MKSKRLQMALLKFSESQKGGNLSDGFEVMNLDEASATRGGILAACTCNNGSNYTTKEPDCTCNNGSNYG
ncbi:MULTISPECIES: hypothetical protein [Sphingobacterium]|uniref:Natural product n=1 Tax=Sphingobacterium zeae TaxID=1776859 RepID=A0ABU0U2T0_9SPHI|nr:MULTISPECIES: hypothetical protein [Sphingobacterium]MDQ1149272.1 hypothetical protein [Sphingobacterium zeae]MDR6737414.1 hypothetical protein [Sphingobacterium sp. 2149]